MQIADISRNLSKKLIAISLMLLILVMPMTVYAQKENYNDYNNRYSEKNYYSDNKYDYRYGNPENLGEAIVVNVVDYEPKVIKSSQVEAADVPVYVFLQGLTLGSLLGAESLESEPFIAQPNIRSVVVFPDAASSQYIKGTPIYIRPNYKELSVNNLGYLIVNLRQIKDETKVPEEITLNMTAKIYFDFLRGFGDISATDMVLKEYGDEDKWKQVSYENSFWNQKGYLRLVNVDGSRARIQIYDNYISPLNLALNLDEEDTSGKRLQESGVLTMSIGETRSFVIPGSSAFFRDRVRIRLNDISDPKDSVTLKVISNGKITYHNLIKGMVIAPSSEWKVDSIELKNEKYFVTLKNTLGNKVILNTTKKAKQAEISIGENLEQYENNICGEKDIYDSEQGDYEKESEFITNTLNEANKNELEKSAKKFYCTAINEYKKAKSDNIQLNDEINLGIAKSYSSLAAYIRDQAGILNALALYYLQKVSDSSKVGDLIKNIEKELYNGEYSEPYFLGDENMIVSIISINPVGDKDKSFAETNLGTVYENSVLPYKGEKDSTTWEWKVTSIKSDSITIQKFIKEKGKLTADGTKMLYLDKEELVDDKPILVKDIITKKRVYVTITPGSGDAYSESTFTIHIPIEKRLIQWTPEQIDKMIEETTKQIKILEGYISQLDNIIKSWKYICFATFALLTVKNSFLAGSERNQARKDIMPTYTKKCEQEVAFKQFDTFDDCMNEYADQIETELDDAKGKQEEIESCYKEGNDCYSTKYSDLYPKDYNSYKTNLEDLKVGGPLDENTLKEIDKCRSYLNKLDTFEEKCKALEEDAKKRIDAFNKAIDLAQKSTDNNLFNFGDDKDKKRYSSTEITTAYQAALEYELNKPSSDLIKNVNDKITKEYSGITINDLVAIKAYNPDPRKSNEFVLVLPDKVGKSLNIEKNLLKATYQDTSAGQALLTEYGKECNTPQTVPSRACTDERIQLDKPLEVSVGGKDVFIYKKSDGTYYAALDSIQLSDEGLRDNYASDALAQFDDQERPYCVPTSKGNYIRIYGYTYTGDPEPGKFDEWNVGADGKLCTDDDKQISDWKRMESRVGEVTNLARKVGKCKEGGSIKTKEGIFGCSQLGYKIAQQAQRTHCQDVMDPSDCKTLFAVCDPVMCPASRFNLGGKWPVDGSVVQTGIIGSLILGLPNFPEDPVPICLPGILAGLKSIKSLLDGFVSCLHAAKENHENIGICDKIRSVGICELIWREAINIFKLRGSLVDVISEKLFDKTKGSGGEYISDFNKNIDAVSDSVNFFTKEYAESAFAAYKGKSTAEFGTEICRSAIYGKFSDIGDFVDQLVEPENPPQFFAQFDESPWVTVAGVTYSTSFGKQQTSQSEYSVYYHIYAGTIPEFVRTGYAREGIRYSVYLRGPYGILPVTTRVEGQIWDSINYDSYKDISIERFGPSGMTQICVNINGKEDCGFGKVSTDFAVDKLNDFVIKAEAERTIQRAEDCVPSVPTLSPTLQQVGVQEKYSRYSVLPTQPGLLSSGVVRTCSVLDPDSGNDDNWEPIGSCGTDKQGRDLGTCWIDKRTTKLQDLEQNKQLQEFIIQKSQEIENSPLLTRQIEGLFSKVQSEQYLKELDAEKENNKNKKDELKKLITEGKQFPIYNNEGVQQKLENIGYRAIAEKSIDVYSRIHAQIRIAEIYVLLAGTIAKPAEEEIITEGIEISGVCTDNSDCTTGYCEAGICTEVPRGLSKQEDLELYCSGFTNEESCAQNYCKWSESICVPDKLTEEALEGVTITLNKGQEKVAGLRSFPGLSIKLLSTGTQFKEQIANVFIDPCGVLETGRLNEIVLELNNLKELTCEEKRISLKLTKLDEGSASILVNVKGIVPSCSDCGKELLGRDWLGWANPCDITECGAIPYCYAVKPGVGFSADCKSCPRDCKGLNEYSCKQCNELCNWNKDKKICNILPLK